MISYDTSINSLNDHQKITMQSTAMKRYTLSDLSKDELSVISSMLEDEFGVYKRIQVAINNIKNRRGVLLGEVVGYKYNTDEEEYDIMEENDHNHGSSSSNDDAYYASMSKLLTKIEHGGSYCISGREYLTEQMYIKYPMNSTFEYKTMSLESINVRELIKNSKHSDERNVYEISPIDLVSPSYSFGTRHGLLNSITCSINQNFVSSIELVPLKMNIYGPGDKSQFRVELSEERIGLVIICLPQWHSRGDHSIISGSVKNTFSFSEEFSKEIQWIAFFDDCIQQIEPIIDGYQITVTYGIVNMKRENPCFRQNMGIKSTDLLFGNEDETRSIRFIDEFVSSLIHRNEPLGVILNNSYNQSELSDSALEGSDKELYEALKISGCFELKLESAVFYNVFKKTKYCDNWKVGSENKHIYRLNFGDTETLTMNTAYLPMKFIMSISGIADNILHEEFKKQWGDTKFTAKTLYQTSILMARPRDSSKEPPSKKQRFGESEDLDTLLSDGFTIAYFNCPELYNIRLAMEDPLKIFKSIRDHLMFFVEKHLMIGEVLGRTTSGMQEANTEVTFYSELAEAVSNLHNVSNYCVGGTVLIEDSCELILNDHSSFNIQNIETNMEQFLTHFRPAVFGNLVTRQTEYNPEVRSAKEAVRFKFNIEPSFISAITKHIQDHLNSNISLRTYRVNVYGPGDFFKPHVDTPVDLRNMIGSVVVCLPFKHSGGQLHVKCGSQETIFDFSEHSGNKNVVQWAAFFSDNIHQVKPVKEGYRITITYSIMRNVYYSLGSNLHNSKTIELKYSMNRMEQMKFVEEILKLMDNNMKDSLGIMLKHKYTMTGLCPDGLKGSDKLLFEVVSSHDPISRLYYIDIIPAVLHEYDDEGNMYFLNRSEFEFKEDTTGRPVYDLLGNSAMKVPIPFIMADSKVDKNDRLWKEYAGGVYSGNGNELEYDTSLYQTAAIVIISKTLFE
jgi:hypothetical protein